MIPRLDEIIEAELMRENNVMNSALTSGGHLQ
jgi:hypothetical protein